MENGHNDIRQKFLDRNDIFALEFHEGLVFLQVRGYETNRYEPYTQIGSIPSQNNSGFTRLNDPNGDDILYVEERDSKVIHTSIGQYPSDVRRWTNYPEGENRLRTIPNLNVPRSSNGDDFGFIDGNDSPYQSPSDAQELVIPPGVHLDFDFYNTDPNEAKQPILSILMREYNINTIDPKKNPDIVKRVVSPGSPMPIYPVGSIDNQIRFGDLQNRWGVQPMDESQVRSMNNNRRGGGR